MNGFTRRNIPLSSRLTLQFVACISAFVLGAGDFAQANEDAGAIRPDLVFAHPGDTDLLLDLYMPKNVAHPPLVIYIHGGAWGGGSRKECWAKWLVEEGYAVASISYRFSKEAIFPAQLDDCKAAVRWLREHSAQYGYNTDKIGVVGHSAGGHLAVLLGTTGSKEDGTQVQAVVDYYGPTDFILRATDQPQFTNTPGSRVYRLLGGTPAEKPELARQASGAFQVSADDAPLLIFHGTADNIVLPNQSERLFAAAKSAGLEAELHIVPGANHEPTPFLTPEYCQLVLQFLEKHLVEANLKRSPNP